MFDFPTSPANGDVSNGYTWNAAASVWQGGPGIAGPVTEQFFDASGLTTLDIPVPTWAKGVRFFGTAQGVTGVQLRVSFDGTTFLAGASDYSYAGAQHATGTNSYASTAPVNSNGIAVSATGGDPLFPHNITGEMNLVRPASPTTVFVCKIYSKFTDTNAALLHRTWWADGWVATAAQGSNLAIKALRLYPTAGTFGAGSFVKVEWLGDSAAIPQTNAIADAPNDSYQYLRGQNAWNSGGTLSGDLTINKAIPYLWLDNTNAPAGGGSTQFGFKRQNSMRWLMYSSATSDNFGIARYNDAGVLQDNPIQITRTDATVTLAGVLAVGGSASVGGSLTTSSAISLGGQLAWSNISNFVIGYGGVPTFTIGSGVYTFAFSGTAGYTFSHSSTINTQGLLPYPDNMKYMGASSNRWTGIYAVTGTIMTSDENEKQDIRPLDDAEKRVAQACRQLITAYRWRNAVEAKGDDARIHVGIIAQRVEEAFAAEGLEARRYALFCEDEILEHEEAVVENDVTVKEARSVPTGKMRLGVRYDQLLAFIIGGM